MKSLVSFTPMLSLERSKQEKNPKSILTSKANTKYNLLHIQNLQYHKRGFLRVLWKTLTFINHVFIQ